MNFIISRFTNFQNFCIKSAASIVQIVGAVVRYSTFSLSPFFHELDETFDEIKASLSASIYPFFDWLIDFCQKKC